MDLNGAVIFAILHKMGGRAAVNQLIECVSKAVKKPVNFVRDTVTETIEGGVRLGYLQREGHYIISSNLTNNMVLKERRAYPQRRRKPRQRGKKRRGAPQRRKKNKGRKKKRRR